MKKLFELLKQDFWKNNAIFVQMLGLCPTLAVTSSAVNALGLSIATTCILTLTNTMVSLLLIASLVTCTQIIMEAFTYTLYEALGIFIALIATNCIIIGRAEAYASKNNVVMSFFDGLFVGLGYTFVLVIIGSIREIIGKGTWFKGLDQLLGFRYADTYLTVLDSDKTLLIAILPPGAFITLGLLIAFKNFVDLKILKTRTE